MSIPRVPRFTSALPFHMQNSSAIVKPFRMSAALIQSRKAGRFFPSQAAGFRQCPLALIELEPRVARSTMPIPSYACGVELGRMKRVLMRALVPNRPTCSLKFPRVHSSRHQLEPNQLKRPRPSATPVALCEGGCAGQRASPRSA